MSFGDWSLPDLTPYSHIIPSSTCWDNYQQEDDIFDIPQSTHNSPKYSSTSKIIDDQSATITCISQSNTEDICKTRLILWLTKSDITANARLDRRSCIEYCLDGLQSLSKYYSNLDCSRTWICYWILNSLLLLNAEAFITEQMKSDIIHFIKKCQCINGGFSGGPQQSSHIASSFGAVMTLIMIGNETSFSTIDRLSFYKFLMRNKQKDGSFSVNFGGEIDIRGVYCGLACAAILNILDKKLCSKTLIWLSNCQTYEGGFSQEPNDESHGGYAYCGIAAIIIILTHFPGFYYEMNVNVENLIRWQVFKQMQFEGGFCGRTNKLVDSCYSFWVGAVFPMIDILKSICQCFDIQKLSSLDSKSKENEMVEGKNDNFGDLLEKKIEITIEMNENNCLFHSLQLQKYILICGQHRDGGIRDKPPKSADYYHTCYGLSGLSIAQYCGEDDILGPEYNQLCEIDAVYGIVEDKLQVAFEYYKKLPSIEELLMAEEVSIRNSNGTKIK